MTSSSHSYNSYFPAQIIILSCEVLKQLLDCKRRWEWLSYLPHQDYFQLWGSWVKNIIEDHNEQLFLDLSRQMIYIFLVEGICLY